MNTKVFRNLSYGVYVISSLDGERPTGCIANSVMQITSSPATIALSMNHDNYTNSCIAVSGKFAVSILSEESDPGLIGNIDQSGGHLAVFFFEAFATQTDFTDLKAGSSQCSVLHGVTPFLFCPYCGDKFTQNDPISGMIGLTVDFTVADKLTPGIKRFQKAFKCLRLDRPFSLFQQLYGRLRPLLKPQHGTPDTGGAQHQRLIEILQLRWQKRS